MKTEKEHIYTGVGLWITAIFLVGVAIGTLLMRSESVKACKESIEMGMFKIEQARLVHDVCGSNGGSYDLLNLKCK